MANPAASFIAQDVTFTYPQCDNPALDGVQLTAGRGDFIVVCGPTGCGKTTLLRQLKPGLTPHGIQSGTILFEGEPLAKLSRRDAASRIGYVMQNPDDQIVTDKVWHELAFGLESLGLDTPTIRLRVAEMASFFGIQTWFDKDVGTLSGGQKQLLALASVMAMHPHVLILDEPTSQLDPTAATDFLAVVERIHQELGVTILLTEHRLEEALPLANRLVVMDGGTILYEGTPSDVGRSLLASNHDLSAAMPTPMRVWARVANPLPCPVTVREGREWLDRIVSDQENPVNMERPRQGQTLCGTLRKPAQADRRGRQPVIELHEAWFRYEKNSPDVLKGVTLHAYSGETTAILGGNGTGKTTALSLMAGLRRPYRGKVRLYGREWDGKVQDWLFGHLPAVLPQDSHNLFVEKTVRADLCDALSESPLSNEEKNEALQDVIALCRLERLLERHPYDLSGGERQRAALAKVLLPRPRILLLDEPTKGLDAGFKTVFAAILKDLANAGAAVVIVSHDVEFCAEYADRCALFFDGKVVTENEPRAFFSGNHFYTTAANRMARHLWPQVVKVGDVTAAIEGATFPSHIPSNDADGESAKAGRGGNGDADDDWDGKGNRDDKAVVGASLTTKDDDPSLSSSLRTSATPLLLLLAIPFTVYMGVRVLDNHKSYFISLLVLLEATLPFILTFERRKPKPREMVVIAVLCAIGVAGRAAFFMLPQIKPEVAVILIAGVALGSESGFFIGAMTGFVSNLFFGQGPWTPWQMFALGAIGFLAGLLFRKGRLPSNRLALCLFGGLVTLVVYGGVMNPATVLLTQAHPNAAMFLTAYTLGLPFDLLHAAATIVFLAIAAEPMLDKLRRVQVKYGLVESE